MDVEVEFSFADQHLRVTADYEEGEEESGLHPSFTVYCVEVQIAANLYLDISDLVSKAMGDLGGDDPISNAAWEAYKAGNDAED
jgi:hypothetical protein